MMLEEAIQRWARCMDARSMEACPFAAADLWISAGVLVGVLFVAYAGRKIVRALLTLPALALMPALSRRLANCVKSRDYTEEEFLRADGAGETWVELRKKALDRLAAFLHGQQPQSVAWAKAIRESFSDLRFTDANRVPFPFVRVMREKFNLCSVVTASQGPRLQNLDGHWTLDVSGSYGVNVAGFDRYKDWIEKGWEHVKRLGPVLGPLHPIVADNIAVLKKISHMDEVSFHMSGTEAVMAAVRMARFNTRRKLIVCFSGAYHGWWDGVQPGLGSERALDDCLTLKDIKPASLAVIRRRANEIAGVLVNPVQSFHPNSPPPNDAVLLTSGVRKTAESTIGYARWLRQLRDVCTAHNIPLIFDEVYTGFRLAPGGAQQYFGVRADMVVYGKTVAGGLPIGVVCGKKSLMRRFDPEHPMRIAYVVGTFSAHPAVMGAMNEFLRWVADPATAKLYDESIERCAKWVRSTNEKLAEASLPLRIVNLATVWTVLFKEPSRYNWLLQYYLQAPKPLVSFYSEVMQRKKDDHHASHGNGVNQFFHLLSSTVFIYCYLLAFYDLTTAMCLGLAALFVRQFGHAILEPPCHDKEKLLLGYNTRNKTLIVLGYVFILLIPMAEAHALSWEILGSRIGAIALNWLLWTVLVVLGRVVYLVWKHGLWISMIWLVKLITDPVTDIFAYFPRWPQRA